MILPFKMLNSSQIARALNGHPWTMHNFLGVFPSDRLPLNIAQPSCLVVNTDPSNAPGAHWLAIYVDKDGIIDYFDSYGLPPQVETINSWLQLRGSRININNRIVQSYMSAACGQHCIYFLILRCRGFPMRTITNMLSDSPFINDSFVTAYVNKHCNLNTQVFDEKVLVEQLCTVFGLI